MAGAWPIPRTAEAGRVLRETSNAAIAADLPIQAIAAGVGGSIPIGIAPTVPVVLPAVSTGFTPVGQRLAR